MNRNDKNHIVNNIRSQYVEKEISELDELRELDKNVKRPASVFAYVFGSIGALILGAGMSLIMTDIGSKLGIAEALIPGIAIGAVGLIMTLINFPIFNKILGSRRKKYAYKIIELSDKIIDN